MLAEDRKTPHHRKRSRRATVEDTPPTAVLVAAPEFEAYPDEAEPTELSELSELAEPTMRVSASTTRKPATTARPISLEDRRLVETAEWMTRVLPVLGSETNELAVIDPIMPPATLDDAEAPAITIVGGDSTSKMVAMRYAPPKRTKRHWLSGAVILTLIATVSLTAIATVTPLATGHAQGLAVRNVGPLGLPLALDAANQSPSGQWVATIGLQPNQDVGGGAGPGVQAPGSAGLPVSSVKTIVNTGAPAAAEAGAISPPPLSPWPPSWAYAAVPGYGSFGMSDVGGYYSWAFGQCTWWAQYERKDENLMHMGNAQFWASGAAARGYHVGGQPQVGATVVFQPGVQGAGGAGHVAHVVKVYPDGWFLVAEMNFYWNGGGWGRVDYRLAHAGSGVQFIY